MGSRCRGSGCPELLIELPPGRGLIRRFSIFEATLGWKGVGSRCRGSGCPELLIELPPGRGLIRHFSIFEATLGRGREGAREWGVDAGGVDAPNFD